MDPEVYVQVKLFIKKAFSINLDHYKDEQMRRRLDSWLVRSGVSSWQQYFKTVQSDPKESSRFRDYLTINVSAFFRDPERWQALRENILPELNRAALQLRPTGGGLRIWSAGCSIGPEPYSLAMTLEEITPGRRHQILATDLDRGALAKAKARGPYTSDDIQNMTAGQRANFLVPGGPPFHLKEMLSKRIEFREHDMLNEAFPVDYDLILCRNVVIYFTTETKETLYRKFFNALRPGGILFVGATEIIPRPQEIGFRSYGISFYKKDV
jgi:chemotaxis protein methyltransferase CheR